MNTSARNGNVDNTSMISRDKTERYFPSTISKGVILVVRRTSSVCLSFSPEIVLAVSAGTTANKAHASSAISTISIIASAR